MSALAEIKQRIQNTIALIAEHENAVLHKDAPPSLLANIRALEKQKRRWEREFEELAASEELEICRYRLLIEEPTLTAITEAWGNFQALFSSVYDAVKNGPKKRGRMSRHDTLATQFKYGFTFEGSVGVVLTLSRDKDDDADLLRATIESLFGMARARGVEEVAAFVERLGVPPIVRLNRWVKAHTAFESGAAVEWRSSRAPAPANLAVQLQEFKLLQGAIETVSEPRIVEQTMPGFLLGASIGKHRFEIRLDTGEEIDGTFTDAISQEHTVVLPKHYQAVIRKTTQIKEATEQEEVSYFLVRLGRPLHT